MVEVRISYETLFDILRREKNRDELQELQDSFFKDLQAYLDEKQAILDKAMKENTPFAVKEREGTRIQLENVAKILKELMERRENKIIRLAQDHSRNGLDNSKGVLEEERPFFDNMASLLGGFRTNITNIIERKKAVPLPTAKKVEKLPQSTKSSGSRPDADYSFAPDFKTVRITNNLPRFLGRDMKVFGPFDEDEIASLPSEIADLLVRKGRAEEITQSF